MTVCFYFGWRQFVAVCVGLAAPFILISLWVAFEMLSEAVGDRLDDRKYGR